MAIMVLGGIDYYVQECTPLTSRGVIYRNKIISYHEINEEFLPINPTYIKGALAVSGYDCHEMYELIELLEDGVVEEPEHPLINNKYFIRFIDINYVMCYNISMS